MSFLAYHGAVWSRAWRDTVTFVKAHVLGGLVIAVVTAIVTGLASADIGEAFNVRVAIYAAVAAGGIVAFWVLWWNLMAAPWRLYEEQAARLRAFEQRPDVGPLIACRERGIKLLNHPVQDEHDLTFFRMDVRAWEAETEAELKKCGTKADLSEFSVLGLFPPRMFPGVITEHNAELAILAERLERLRVVIRRIEGSAS